MEDLACRLKQQSQSWVGQDSVLLRAHPLHARKLLSTPYPSPMRHSGSDPAVWSIKGMGDRWPAS